MFDLSWMELLFCGVLGLIVVGPKDLPKMMRSIGGAVKRAKSVYRDMQTSLGTLEKEIDLASGADKKHSWVGYVPDEIRNLPDFLPENYVAGTMSAEDYRQRFEDHERRIAALQQLAAQRKAAEQEASSE